MAWGERLVVDLTEIVASAAKAQSERFTYNNGMVTPMLHPNPVPYDVAIVGAGPVGVCLAGLLARGAAHLRVVVLEAASDASAWIAQDRTLALSDGSRQTLEQAGVWPRGTTPIQSIHISQKGALGRTVISCEECRVPALGHVVGYSDLLRDVPAQLERIGVELRMATRVQSRELCGDRVVLKIGSPTGERALHCHLAVVADGGGASFADLPAQEVKDYGQTGLIALVQVDRPLNGRAWERFTPQGPAALLPRRLADRPGQHWASLVWTVPSADTERYRAMCDDDFLAEFAAHFGTRAGRFLAVRDRKAFPLRLKSLAERTAPRVAVLGNAAQTLHPIAGQGLNLGIRDAAALAGLLTTAGWQDNVASVLASYESLRVTDAHRTISFTDFLVRTFSTDSFATTVMRGLGLVALDMAPAARAYLANRMLYGAPR